MKVLITGATGLVGRELVSLFDKNDIAVNYLSTSRDKLINKNLYKGFYWNPEKGEIDPACIEDVDTIIHLAGATIAKRWTAAYKKQILDSRVQSANLLYKLLKEKHHTVSHFISASAVGIYPDSLTEVYDEDEQRTDNSFLGMVVKEWEASARKMEGLGLKVSMIRTGLVLSGDGGALPQMAKPVRFGVGSGIGSGHQMQSWIHIEDLVNIYFYIYKKRLEGIYNAVAPYPVSNSVLMAAIAHTLHKPYFMPNVPRFILKALLGEMHMLLFTSQNINAKKIMDAGYRFKYLSLERALKEELA